MPFALFPAFPAKAGNQSHALRSSKLRLWMPAFERVKKSKWTKAVI